MHLTEQQHDLSCSSRFICLKWLNILARFDAKNCQIFQKRDAIYL